MKYVISLGGSVIVPKNIDTNFLKGFRDLLKRHIKFGKSFAIVCGGGYTSRAYQKAAASVSKITQEESDKLGIEATKLNAQLVKTILKEFSFSKIIENPNEKIRTKEKIIVASGWRPGCSTDYIAVLIAKNMGAKTILNISNIDYVYTSDPKINKKAKPIEKIRWGQFKKMLPKKWSPGLSTPFDPIATKMAEKLGLKVIIMGPDLKNIDNFLSGKYFKGTTIS